MQYQPLCINSPHALKRLSAPYRNCSANVLGVFRTFGKECFLADRIKFSANSLV